MIRHEIEIKKVFAKQVQEFRSLPNVQRVEGVANFRRRGKELRDLAVILRDESAELLFATHFARSLRNERFIEHGAVPPHTPMVSLVGPEN